MTTDEEEDIESHQCQAQVDEDLSMDASTQLPAYYRCELGIHQNTFYLTLLKGKRLQTL